MLLAFAFGFSLWLLAEPASPDEPTEAARPVNTVLSAAVVDGEMVGQGQDQGVLMYVGGRRLMLIVPQGFRADTTNPEQVAFANPDFSCVLSFRVAAPGRVAVSSLNASLCRRWLATRFVNASILEEFSLTVPSGSGPAFDLICKVDGVARTSRVAFIASSVGVLEFTSLSSPEKSEVAKVNLRFLLRGLRNSGPNGKFEFLPAQSES